MAADISLNVPLSSRLTFSLPNTCLDNTIYLLNIIIYILHFNPSSLTLRPSPCPPQSTLLNLIQSKLDPSTGYIHVNPQLRLGIFTQHHLDSFDLSLSPLQVKHHILHLSIDCVCALNCFHWVYLIESVVYFLHKFTLQDYSWVIL